MPDPYTVLDVPPDADDETIRRRYLELIRQYTPEHHPDRFAAVRAAYEKVKDLDSRVRHRLFEAGKDDPIEAIIEEAACRTPRRRAGLRAILAAVLAAP
ncbi:MAG: DnaJ-class molecular chaperone with C-terminal Zn finger domain [Gemmataceae bacterium]|nr:DnaJ-class molecular chaperone with C-terminal Zn finger domain [Gemmataceae bacterium]